MMGGELTASQIAAHERSKAFHNRIATLAQKLKVGLEAPVPKIVAEPEAQPEPAAPLPTPWFSVLHEIEPTPRPHPSVTTIQNAVCAHYVVSRREMLSHSRARWISFPRQVAMYLCTQLTPLSLPHIGKRFGGRDHSTAHHAREKIARMIVSDEKLAAAIDEIQRSLTA
jgi:hypothetical protein